MNSRMIPVALCQQSYGPDVAANRKKNLAAIAQAAAEGAKLVVLSELHDSLYFCQTENVDTHNLAHSLEDESCRAYADAARRHGVVLVCSFFEKRAPGLSHNTSVVYDTDGSEAGRYRKMHIPDDPAYYEKFYFTPGDLGFRPISTSLGVIGVLVCWDQWFPEAARIMALSGAEMLIYPTAIGLESTDTPEEQQRQREAWITVQRGHAVANGLPVVTVNRTGFEPDPSGATGGIQFWGSSFAAGPQGEFLYLAPADREEIKVVEIDLNRSEQVRRWWPFLRDRRIDAYSSLLKRFND